MACYVWHYVSIISCMCMCMCVYVFISGVRKVRLDPVECLFSFICSSNNNISRIHTMVESLCRTFGTYLCKLDDKDYYSFPSIEKLAGNMQTLSVLLITYPPMPFVSWSEVFTYSIVVCVSQRVMSRHS